MNDHKHKEGAPPCTGSRAIILLSDARYAQLTELCLASLALSGTRDVNVIIFQKGYNQPLPVKLLTALRQAGISACVRDTSAIDHDFGYMSRPDHPHGSRVPNLKAICIDHVSLDYERIFYCDGDVLFMQPLDWASIDPGDKPLSAVLDFATGTGLTEETMARRAVANGYSDRYFNSGVMYINATIWRDQRMLDRFMTHHRSHEAHCPYLGHCTHNDQCAFNMTFDGQWRELGLEFNAQKICMHTPVWRDAIIRHYTGPKKVFPLHYASCDAREYNVLSRSLDLIDEKSPLYDRGIAYWANSVRRRRVSRRIAGVLRREMRGRGNR